MYIATFNSCHNPMRFSERHFMEEEVGSETETSKGRRLVDAEAMT